LYLISLINFSSIFLEPVFHQRKLQRVNRMEFMMIWYLAKNNTYCINFWLVM